jgi:predicted transcriptional regulator
LKEETMNEQIRADSDLEDVLDLIGRALEISSDYLAAGPLEQLLAIGKMNSFLAAAARRGLEINAGAHVDFVLRWLADLEKEETALRILLRAPAQPVTFSKN